MATNEKEHLNKAKLHSVMSGCRSSLYNAVLLHIFNQFRQDLPWEVKDGKAKLVHCIPNHLLELITLCPVKKYQSRKRFSINRSRVGPGWIIFSAGFFGGGAGSDDTRIMAVPTRRIREHIWISRNGVKPKNSHRPAPLHRNPAGWAGSLAAQHRQDVRWVSSGCLLEVSSRHSPGSSGMLGRRRHGTYTHTRSLIDGAAQ